MEPEAYLEVGSGIGPVRMQMGRVRNDTRARLEQPCTFGVDDVGVATDLVHRPGDTAGAWIVEHARGVDHVVEDV